MRPSQSKKPTFPKQAGLASRPPRQRAILASAHCEALELRRLLTADFYRFGTAGADDFTLVRSGSSINLFQNQSLSSTPVVSLAVSSLGAINLFGNGGSDTVTLDYSGGDPIPGGLYFDDPISGSAQPKLIITHAGIAPQYTLSAITSGPSLQVNAGSISDLISFSHLPQLDLFHSTGSAGLTIASGSATFNQDLGANGSSVDVTVAPYAAINFGSTQHLNSLTIQTTANANMLPAGQRVLVTNTLTVAGVLDLANNDLIVNSPSTASSTALQNAVAAWVNNTATQGIIESSTAATDGMTIGITPASALAAIYQPVTQVDGQTVNQTTALIASYTIQGDVNLDGFVNGADLGIIASNFNTFTGTNPPQYAMGDINFDGYINGVDFGELASNFNSWNGVSLATTTVGQTYTATLPTPVTSGSAVQWNIGWGDGTFGSYAGSATSAAHVYTQTGYAQIQLSAVTYDSTAGYSSYIAPAQSLVITSTGVTATPISLTASSASDVFTISADNSGDTLITKNGTVIATQTTASILSLSITGSPATVNIDFTNGDPLPASGFTTDAANLQLSGPHGTDPLITTATAAYLGTDEIRFAAGTTLTNNITNTAGVFALSGEITLNDPAGGNLYVATNATVILSGSQTLGSLHIAPGGTVRQYSTNTAFGGVVLTVGQLTIDGPDSTANSGGMLDLGTGDLVLRQTSASLVFPLLRAGYDDGFWDGVASTGANQASIVSSGAANDPYRIESLGFAQIGSTTGSLAIGAFDAVNLLTGDVLVARTYSGDANLDYAVDATDYDLMNTVLPAAANSVTRLWTSGDFNFDGIVAEVDRAIFESVEAALVELTASQPTTQPFKPTGNISGGTVVGTPVTINTNVASGIVTMTTGCTVTDDKGNTHPGSIGLTFNRSDGKTAVGSTHWVRIVTRTATKRDGSPQGGTYTVNAPQPLTTRTYGQPYFDPATLLGWDGNVRPESNVEIGLDGPRDTDRLRNEGGGAITTWSAQDYLVVDGTILYEVDWTATQTAAALSNVTYSVGSQGPVNQLPGNPKNISAGTDPKGNPIVLPNPGYIAPHP